MKKFHSFYSWAAACLLLAAFLTPLQAEGQLLKKISKGIDRVNKGIDRVNRTLDHNGKATTHKTTPQRTDGTTGTPDTNPGDFDTPDTDTDTDTGRRTATADWRTTTPKPHLTQQTRFLRKNVSYDHLSPVSEGIFYLQETNRKLGYANYYGFWTVDGKCLFPAVYENFAQGHPRFNSGACVMKQAGTQRHSPVILYADGSARPLSHEWEAMTQFYDGVAMVREIVEMRTTHLFYINTNGEKIWPHLALTNPKSIALEMRPLRDGLRAYYSNNDRAWGYLNDKGVVVIKPQYAAARDYAGGYALVLQKTTAGHKAKFIDRQGNTVVEVPGDEAMTYQLPNVSDVSDGHFLLYNTTTQAATFYNLRGEAVKSYPAASGFADGYAFYLTEKYGSQINVINRNFQVIGQWPVSAENAEGLQGERMLFGEVPYYTYNQEITINTAGDPVMYQYRPVMSENALGQFSPDGYAPARSVLAEPNAANQSYIYTGYIDTKGRYVVVFSDEDSAAGPFAKGLPTAASGSPGHLYGGSTDVTPPGYILPPLDTIPAGPRGGGEESLRYHVNVKAYPAEAAKVLGTGDYAYGDTLRVCGTPAKGWKLAGIESSRTSSTTSKFNRFVVKGDMDITCYFSKEEEFDGLPKSAMAGMLREMPLPVYLQIGGEGNRYASPSQGFMAIEMPEGKVGGDPSDAMSLSVNVFCVPIDVRGIQEEDGRRYLRLNGGVMKYANLRLSDNLATGALNNPLLTMMMAFDNADNGELQPGCYRVEIVDGSLDGATVKFGLMQRYSPQTGWISADDPFFHTPLGGKFFKRVDKGLGAGFLDGVVLKKASPRSVRWEPDASFFNGDRTALDNYCASIGRMLKRSGLVTPLTEENIREFSEDLETFIYHNRFKKKPIINVKEIPHQRTGKTL